MKRFISILMCIISLFLLCSCGSKSDSAIIYYGVKTPPQTIDPQLAQSVTELTIVKNIYEGLLRFDENGKIVPAAAYYEKNGLVYTFYIKDTAVWSNGDKVTADDFLFGLTRALDPATKAPEASSLFAIKNAEKFNSGVNCKLGITTKNENTLIIELEYEDENFLTTLTSAIAMPCNRKFFKESIGKYGMSADTVLCNGSFRLTKWSTEDFAMRLHKNSKYGGNFTAKAAAIFLSTDKDKSVMERLTKNSVDIGEIESSQTVTAKENAINTILLPNTVWLIKFGSGYSAPLKNALVNSLNVYNPGFNEAYSSIELAKNIYPSTFGITETADFYNLENAKVAFENEIKTLPSKKLPTSVIYYTANDSITELIKGIVGHWQQNLGAYINIEPLANNSAVNAKQNENSITIYTETFNSNNTKKYASFFELNNSVNLKQSIENGYVFPIAYSGTVIGYTNTLENIVNNASNYIIDFSFVNKLQ